MSTVDPYDVVIAYAGASAPLAVAARRVNSLAAAAESAREHIVVTMREEGWTWAEVGDALGITAATARQRWHRAK